MSDPDDTTRPQRVNTAETSPAPTSPPTVGAVETFQADIDRIVAELEDEDEQ